ncbi:MAG: flagellar hook-basal body complex protein FliE [Steroidobacteraceae bacterium]|jgi:flagellar hook-basal body complex protein FliE|nr:flagellar hook-basal body complex protein FliE [Steroidobacteraceae bacterium]
MSQMEIDRVLAQIRTIRSEAGGALGALGRPQEPGEGASAAVSFAAVLRSGLDQVNAAQQGARRAATDFELGKPGVDLPQVMLEMQKASVSFRAAVEVRNKLVGAYQEIMNMPV